MAEHATIDLAANEIERAALRQGTDAARRLLGRQLGRRGNAMVLEFNARLCTELRERDDDRRRQGKPPVNLWRA